MALIERGGAGGGASWRAVTGLPLHPRKGVRDGQKLEESELRLLVDRQEAVVSAILSPDEHQHRLA